MYVAVARLAIATESGECKTGDVGRRCVAPMAGRAWDRFVFSLQREVCAVVSKSDLRPSGF